MNRNHPKSWIVTVWSMPVEIPDNLIPFDKGKTHAGYDADAAHTFWRMLLVANKALKESRSSLIGRCSPVHFSWGSGAARQMGSRGTGRRRLGAGSGSGQGMSRLSSRPLSTCSIGPARLTRPNSAPQSFHTSATSSPPATSSTQVVEQEQSMVRPRDALAPLQAPRRRSAAQARPHFTLQGES